jgi:hypothetical protein
MSKHVWCVFQKLPGDACPTLSSICVSRRVAEEVIRLSREEGMGRPGDDARDAEWSVRPWAVVEEETGSVRDAGRISRVLDPRRAGLADPGDRETGPAR